jgi:hypothetical protein
MGFLGMFTSALNIETPTLGKAMINAAVEGHAGLARLGIGKQELLKGHALVSIGNLDAVKLGRM